MRHRRLTLAICSLCVFTNVAYCQNIWFRQCGYNCAIAALSRHGARFATDDIAEELNVAGRFGIDISLEEINKVLVKNGLFTCGIKSDNLIQVFDKHPNVSLIVHTLNDDGGGHFKFLYVNNGKQIVTFDYPHTPRPALSQAKEGASGYALLISRNKADIDAYGVVDSPTVLTADKPTPAVRGTASRGNSDTLKFDLFSSNNREDIIVDHADFINKKLNRSIYLFNSGKADIHIAAIKGSCGCLSISQVDLPRILRPHDSISIALTVDEMRFDWKRGAMVAISTTNDKQPLHVIAITPDQSLPILSGNCMLLPSATDLGYTNNKNITMVFNILVPVEKKNEVIEAFNALAGADKDCAFAILRDSRVLEATKSLILSQVF